MTRLLLTALLACLLTACGGGDPDEVLPVEDKPAPAGDTCTPESMAKFGSCPPKLA